jgi:hypothetical protein
MTSRGVTSKSLTTLKTIKINKEKVHPIQVEQLDKSKIKGSNLFPEIYANVFLLAKKKSGKTSVINKIIKSCSDRHTKFIIFCSTIHRDPTWKSITKFLKDRGNELQIYTSIKEQGQDMLEDILKELEDESMQQEHAEEEALNQETQVLERFVMPALKIYDSENEEEPNPNRKPRMPSKKSAEMFFIFDDLSSQMRLPSLSKLIKTNRHYKSKVIISSQYSNDLQPEVIKNLDYLLLFGRNKIEKLQHLHQTVDMSLEFDKFLEVYRDATSVPYSFLWFETSSEECRKGFNQKYVL